MRLMGMNYQRKRAGNVLIGDFSKLQGGCKTSLDLRIYLPAILNEVTFLKYCKLLRNRIEVNITNPCNI